MASEERPRARDSDLGELHVNYIKHLADKVAGKHTELELSSAEHQAIRNILKDNQIFVEPDIDNESEHKGTVNLALHDGGITPLDFHRHVAGS